MADLSVVYDMSRGMSAFYTTLITFQRFSLIYMKNMMLFGTIY